MKKIDKNIIDELMSFCDISTFGPGSLLYNPNNFSLNTQLEFLISLLEEIQPTHVLETGTESGMFSYFIKCIIPTVKITTFGMDGTSDGRGLKCVNYLNLKFGDYINYIEGDSVHTLTNYNTLNNIDFAWIDGGHYDNTPYIDLKNCNRLKIANICIDDYNLIVDVAKCVDNFLNDYPQYTIKNITNDERGICHIKL